MPISPEMQRRIEAFKKVQEDKEAETKHSKPTRPLTAIPDEDVPDIAIRDDEVKDWLSRQNIEREWIKLTHKSDPKLLTRGRSKTGKGEHVKVRCPSSSHNDEDPSASINITRNVWECHACSIGGGIFEAVAARLGVDRDSNFKLIIEEAAKDLGYHPTTTGPKEYMKAVAEEDEKKEEEPVATIHSHPTKVEASLREAEKHEKDEPPVPIPLHPHLKDTFLAAYQELLAPTPIPEQFIAATSIMAASMALGQDYVLYEAGMLTPVNIGMLLVGTTGSGKSTAINFLEKVLREGLPFNREDVGTKGTMILRDLTSGEGFVDAMHIIVPPSPASGLIVPTQIEPNVLTIFEEFIDLVSVHSRVGSTLKSKILQTFDNTPLERHLAGKDPVLVKKYLAGFISGTQTRRVRDLLKEEGVDDGSINRMIIFFGTKKPRQARNKTMLSHVAVSRKLAELQNWAVARRNAKPDQSPDVEFSEAGGKMYDEWAENVLWPMMESREEEATLHTRAEPIAKKLMTIFAGVMNQDTIGTEAVEVFIETYWLHISQGWDKVLGVILSTPEKELRDSFLDAIKRCTKADGKPPTIAKIERVMGKTRERYSDEIFLKVIKHCCELGLVNRLPRTVGLKGRPAGERFEYNVS